MKEKQNSLFKNTISLYTRMIFSVCVNLYISRVVLDILGVEDFGIYNIVGGIVVLLGFINSSMSGSTSRFLTIAIGEDKEEKLRDTYNAAKHLHFCIALVVLLFGETFGLWLVNSYLDIPESRMAAANWVYQLSLITTAITIIQVPFSSIIISMERMDAYAGIEIANILLKLSVVLILKQLDTDRLVMYGVLLLVVAFIVYVIYSIFCKRHYGYLKFSKQLQWNVIKPMLTFSGWDLLGWGGYSASSQGRQIFINKFFGVAVNAANGMATTASSAITAFTNNIVMAFRPRIIKHYAAQDYPGMQKLEELALIVVILLMNFLMVPLLFCMQDILQVWLVDVPDKTTEFCRLMLFFSYFEAINTVIKIGIHASGKMRDFTIAGFVLNSMSLILTFVFYKIGFSVYSTYYVAIVLCLITILANLFFLKKFVFQLKISNLMLWILKGVGVCALGMLAIIFADKWIVFSHQVFRFLFILVVNGIIVLLAVWALLPEYVSRFKGYFKFKRVRG